VLGLIKCAKNLVDFVWYRAYYFIQRKHNRRTKMAKALGIDDSINTCDCCGKTNLKCTVAILLDCGEIVHYGRTCAMRNTGKAAPVIAAEIKAHEAAKLADAREEWNRHPAKAAREARYAERPRDMIGKIAADFVCDVEQIASLVRAEIAEKHGILPYLLA
jgi:hypothetical protein